MSDVHLWTATIGTTRLEVISGALTLDEQWAPYIQSELVVVTPDAATLALLDPRADARVVVTMSQTPLGATIPTATASFDLGVRTRETDLVAGSTRLELASDEALLQDYLAFVGTGVPQSIDIGDLIEDTIHSILPGAIVYNPLAGSLVTAARTPEMSLWDYLSPVVNSVGGKLWCNPDRTWNLDADHISFAPPLELSHLTNLVRAVETITRDGLWADAIGKEYKASGGSTGTTWYSVSSAGASKGLVAPASDQEFPGYNELNAYLANRQRLGKTLDIAAVSDYSTDPARPVTITTKDAAAIETNVAAVTFEYPADQMTIRPREWTA